MEEPKKSVAKKIIPVVIIVAVIAAIAAVAVIVISNLPKKVNLNEYISVKFEGYDTLGTAQIKYDEELLEVLGAAVGLSEREISKLESIEKLMEGNKDDFSKSEKKVYNCIKTLEVKLDKTENLSNGESVKLRISYDNDKAKEYKVQFLGENQEVTVKNLDELNIIDAFADYNITFSGIAPRGIVKAEYTGPSYVDDYYYIDYSCFSPDKTGSLKNGDTVTVTLNVYDEKRLLQRGYKVKEFSKTYTVEGLDEYIDEYSKLTSDYLEYAKAEAYDLVVSKLAGSYGNYTVEGLEYAGYLFDSPKPDTNFYNYNDLYIIHKGNVIVEKNDVQYSTVVYFPVQFYNILSTADGLSGEKNGYVLGSGTMPDSGYSVVGYVIPVLAYSDMVANKNDYNVEAGDGFEVFSEYTAVSAIAQISEDNQVMLNNRSAELIRQYIDSSYNKESVAGELSVAGYYLLSSKNESQKLASYNRLYVVCQATVSNTKNRFETTVVYYPVEYDGVVVMPDGQLMFIESRGIRGSSTFPNSYYYTKGYVDGGQMYNDIVAQNRENYTYDMSEVLKQFGE